LASSGDTLYRIQKKRETEATSLEVRKNQKGVHFGQEGPGRLRRSSDRQKEGEPVTQLAVSVSADTKPSEDTLRAKEGERLVSNFKCYTVGGRGKSG